MTTVDPTVVQRIEDAINFRRPDRVPVWEALENKAVYEHFAPGVPFPQCAAIACERLGIDATYGCMQPVEDQDLPTREGFVVASGTLWHTKPRFRTLADLRAWRPGKISRHAIEEQVLEAHQEQAEAYAPHTMFLSQEGGWGFLTEHDTQTWTVIAIAICEDLASLERIWDHRMERAIIRNTAIARGRLCPVVQCCEDIAYKGGLMVSPDLLRTQFWPRFRQVITPFKAAGIKVIWHSDGNIADVLDDAIACGIDGINPVDPSAGMSIAAIRARYPALILVGNVDGMKVLPLGTQEEVRQEVRRCIGAAAGRDGGHLLQCGCGQIMPDVPLGNVIAYLDEAHRFGRYPVDRG